MTGVGWRARPCSLLGEHEGRVRLYPAGFRCSRHSPWALAGRPEPLPGPGWPAGAWTGPSPLGTSRVHDARAVASGKRRSSVQEYRAAQAAVATAPPEVPDLRVDLGEWDRRTGRCIRYPSADYRCPRCGFTDSASGDQVRHFAGRIETDHRAACPNNRKDTT